jgi:hypothetical protein
VVGIPFVNGRGVEAIGAGKPLDRRDGFGIGDLRFLCGTSQRDAPQ